MAVLPAALFPSERPLGFTTRRGKLEAVNDAENTYRDPVVEAYKKDIDRTLLRANLKLAVTERFRRAMAHAMFADELRRAGGELRSQRK